MARLTIQVQGSAADAHDADDGSEFSSTHTNVSMNANGTASSRFNGGFQFANVPIPAGAVIEEAHLQVVTVNSFFDDPLVDIYAEDVDSADDFSTTAAVTSRTVTTASVGWSDTGIDDGNNFVDSPDIAIVIQEVVDRAGWASGNDMAIIVKGRDSGASDFAVQSADSVSPELRARLSLTYYLDASGVVFRYTDANNHCRLFLDEASNELILEKVVSGVVTQVAAADVAIGTAHEIKAMVQGDRIRCWVDFELLIDDDTGSLPSGTRVGLFARNANGTTTFDHFHARGLN